VGEIKPPRLDAVGRVDLPVVEASDLAVRTIDGHTEVLVVGDRTAHVAAGTYEPERGFSNWETTDLSSLPGWPLPPQDGQLEAIAVDGGSLIAIMREDPPFVHVVDTDTGTVVANIRLVAPADSPLAGSWDDPASRGEGLVLLRDGRLLVAKEKRPRALIEFAPIGADARGLSREILLGPDESWDAPTGAVDYAAVAMWKLRGAAKEALDDISSLAIGRTRDIWLLSDRSQRLARLSLETPLAPTTGEIRSFEEIWRLPKQAGKPEGVAAIDAEHVLIAMDTGSMVDNGAIVRRPRQ
jgi:uncharacterized protein YjiK